MQAERLGSWSLALGLALALAAAGPARGEGEAARPATREAGIDRPKLAELLDRKLPEVHFEGVGFADAVDFLRDVSGIQLFVDWKRLEEAKVGRETLVTMNVKNIKTSDAVKQLLAHVGDEKHHPASAADGEILVISTPAGLEAHAAAAKALAAGKPSPALRAQLNRRLPEVKFEGVGLGDALDFVRDVTHITIEVDWKGLESVGVVRDAAVTARFFDVPAGQALLYLLDSIDSVRPLAVTADGDKVLVGPVPLPER